MSIYLVIHTHSYGVSVKAFKHESDAENHAFETKLAAARELGLKVESTDEDELDEFLFERGETVTIEDGELE